MTYPLSVAAVLVLLFVFVLLLRAFAALGTKRAVAYRESLRDATPPHYQGRDAEFDDHGRPW